MQRKNNIKDKQALKLVILRNKIKDQFFKGPGLGIKENKSKDKTRQRQGEKNKRKRKPQRECENMREFSIATEVKT